MALAKSIRVRVRVGQDPEGSHGSHDGVGAGSVPGAARSSCTFWGANAMLGWEQHLGTAVPGLAGQQLLGQRQWQSPAALAAR